MKYNVQHLGAEQDVELGWLSRITNAAELLRIATLQVSESITLHRGSARIRPSETLHVTRCHEVKVLPPRRLHGAEYPPVTRCSLCAVSPAITRGN